MFLKYFLLLMIAISLSGCLAGGGYKMHQLLNKNSTAYFASYKTLNENEQNLVQSWLGNYKVKQSWGNFTYNIDRVNLSIVNGKMIGEFYPTGWIKPEYRVEYPLCKTADESIEDGYYSKSDFKDLGQGITCVSEKESIFILAETTPSTMVKKDNEEFYSSLFYSGSLVTVDKAPYVMKAQIWRDAPAPVLNLEKVK